MPEATATNPDAPETTKKERKAKTPKEPSLRRSNFAGLYPEDAPVKVLVQANPKKVGSKAAEMFELYTGSATVGDFLAKGGTYQDIAYNVGRGFIKVG